VAVGILVACAGRPAAAPEREEELAVYAAVLEQVLNRSWSAGVPVMNVTLDYSGRDVLSKTEAERINASLAARAETLAAFVSANANRRSITQLPTQSPVSIVADTDTGLRGRTSFSRVGFSADEALVQVWHTCGARCGHVSYVLLRKSDGWRVVATVALLQF